jgi:hypothetical protein
MFTVKWINWGCYRVTGYADGSDWVMTPGRDTIRAHGVTASDHVWFHDDRAELHIFDAPQRRLVASLPIGKETQISVSRDGRQLYALVSSRRSKPSTSSIHRSAPSSAASGCRAATTTMSGT